MYIYLTESPVNMPAQKDVEQVVEQPSLVDEVPVPEAATSKSSDHGICRCCVVYESQCMFLAIVGILYYALSF